MMNIEFAQHQKDSIAFQQAVPYTINACATGTGKTAMTIGSELVNLHQNKLDKCIFVCTKGSIGEVLNDYNKFFNFQPQQLYDANTVQDFFNGDSTVAVTRYEWLKHFDKDMMQQLTANNRLGMWWDEAQRLKNGSRDKKQESGTIAHKKAKELRQFCDAFHLVTATPIMTTLDDLWSLMHLANKDVFGDFSYYEECFYVKELVEHPKQRRRKKICPSCHFPLIYNNGWDFCTNSQCKATQTPTGFIPYRTNVKSCWNVVEYKNLDILSQILKNHMFCFFPEQDIHYIDHKFSMSIDTERQYYNIAKDTMNKLDNGEPTPFSTRLIELQYAVDRSYEKRLELYNLANQLKQKGFVLYVSLYNTNGYYTDSTTLDYVKAVLDQVDGLSYRAYSGNEGDDERDENKKWFQEDPTNKCLIITEAGGASLNLQVTNEFIFYNLPAGFGKVSQALGRIVRLFSSFKSFNIHFLLAENSIDIYKQTGFYMYSEMTQKLMNNKLIKLEKPISFNNQMKAELRQYLLWRNDWA